MVATAVRTASLIGRILRSWNAARRAFSANGLESQETSVAPEPYNIALRDLSESGWFNTDSGELFPHFPVAPDDIVLDVGCGDGGKAAFCARQGAHVILVDIDQNEVAAALRSLAPQGARLLTPIVSDSAPLPLGDGVTTRIVASEVIEHVDDPGRFLEELVRVGCSGALYLLTVPDPVAEGLQTQLAPPVYFEKPNHQRIIGRDAFARMVTDAGLTIVHRQSHGFYSALWWVFFWTAGVDLSAADHPLLNRWADTWRALLATPDGLKVKATLDAFMPMSQCIVARKP
jgi:SAM-dependent methyltransferase